MSIKVLLVEDEFNIRNNLTELLEMTGHVVTAAINGLEALEKIKLNKPDIIISDLFMTEMDGKIFYSRLLEEPEFRKIPFLFLTAKVEIQDVCDELSVDKSFFISSDPSGFAE